ncbi:MAG TPA: MCE family protein [Nocardioides sp.]|nr:MCE family protein [Nocardioides sp.]
MSRVLKSWPRTVVAGLLVAGLSGCGPTLTSFTPPGSDAGSGSFEIKAVFADALGVPAHGLVKQDGLVVGEVGAVSAEDWHAVVTLDLEEGTSVPANTVAGVQQSSPLGEVFVSLDTPARPARRLLGAGATIPLSRTSGLVAIEDVIALMGTVTNGGMLQSLRTIVTSISQALNGNVADVRGVLENADAVLHGFATQRQNLTALLGRSATLTDQLAGERHQIAGAIRNLTPVVRQLAGQTGDIVGLLRRLRTLSHTGTRLAASAGDGLVASLRDAGPVLRELNTQAGRMRTFMQRLNTFAPLVSRASPGDFTNIDVDIFVKALTGTGTSGGQTPAPSGQPPPGGGLSGLLGGLLGRASTTGGAR